MIKAVIFDFDNTLYDESLYFYKVFDEFSKRYGIQKDRLKNEFTCNFRLKSKDLFSDILKKIDFYTKNRQEELFSIYKNIDCKINLYNQSYEILDYLKHKNIQTAVITNGTVSAQKNKVKATNLKKYICNIIYAREFGKEFEKPHFKPFLHVINLLKIDTNEALFVGDHPHTDIKGAQNANIKAIRYLNGYASNIPYTCDKNINSLDEIKKYLKAKT